MQGIYFVNELLILCEELLNHDMNEYFWNLFLFIL